MVPLLYVVFEAANPAIPADAPAALIDTPLLARVNEQLVAAVAAEAYTHLLPASEAIAVVRALCDAVIVEPFKPKLMPLALANCTVPAVTVDAAEPAMPETPVCWAWTDTLMLFEARVTPALV